MEIQGRNSRHRIQATGCVDRARIVDDSVGIPSKGRGIGGGIETTAEDLVFQTIHDGRFRAISADKGEALCEVRIARTGMAPTFTCDVAVGRVWLSVVA